MTPSRPGGPAAPTPQPQLHAQIGRLYFRVSLPLVAGSLLIGAAGLSREAAAPLLVLAGLCLGTSALHLLLPPRGQTALRFGFPLLGIAFVVVAPVVSGALSRPVDAAHLSALLLLTPATIMAWTLLLMDHPRTGRLFGLGLTAAVTLLLTRWHLAGTQLTLPGQLPLLALAVCLTVMSYGAAFADINRRHRAGEQALRRDPLTGLLNRRAFDEDARHAAPGGATLALVDLDHFKRVNDLHGHSAGDRVLRGVADVMLDVLGEQGQAYRWGGEEFALLLPGPVGSDPVGAAGALLEQIRTEVARRSFAGGEQVTLSVGLGRAAPGQGAQSAFEQADAALRAAKASGRNRVVLAPLPPEACPA